MALDMKELPSRRGGASPASFLEVGGSGTADKPQKAWLLISLAVAWLWFTFFNWRWGRDGDILHRLAVEASEHVHSENSTGGGEEAAAVVREALPGKETAGEKPGVRW